MKTFSINRKRGKKKHYFPRPSVPKDYIWKILADVRDDLDPYLPEGDERLSKFRQAVRARSMEQYLNFCESVSLQNLKHETLKLEQIRALRLLCCAEKYVDRHTDKTNLQINALTTFLQSEEKCKSVNSRDITNFAMNSDLFESQMFEYAQHFCKIVLSDLDMSEILSATRHGPGSNTDTQYSRTSIVDKYGTLPYSVSDDARQLARSVIMDDPRWLRSLLGSFIDDRELALIGYIGSYSVYYHYTALIVNQGREEEFWNYVLTERNSNVISLVPKSSKTERTIAIEPTMNIFLQLGVDAVIRRKLLKFGINLNSQDKNKSLATEGSITDLLATIDLSAASDTISLNIVKTLLPREWYELLMSLRAPKGIMDFPKLGIKHELSFEKFSSMGNGYTFVLESLIFASLVYGVYRYHGEKWRTLLPKTAVYGDDIIVPTQFVGDVTFLLQRAGFKVNTNKSFVSGPIRESCGNDCWNGYSIRPVFIRSLPEIIPELVVQRNGLYRVFHTYFGHSPSKVIKRIDKWIPSKHRFYGPMVKSVQVNLGTISVPPADGISDYFWLYKNTPVRRHHKRYQRLYDIFDYYGVKRRVLNMPYRLRFWWEEMLNDYKADTQLRDWYGSFHNLPGESLPGQTPSRYTAIGRNNPIVVRRRRYLVFDSEIIPADTLP